MELNAYGEGFIFSLYGFDHFAVFGRYHYVPALFQYALMMIALNVKLSFSYCFVKFRAFPDFYGVPVSLCMRS